MIPKGLKVGDIYYEGRMPYKVTKVLGDGRYEGSWTGQFASSEPSVEQPKDESVDYSSMPYAQLQKLCAEKGLDATGKKEDLIARLEG